MADSIDPPLLSPATRASRPFAVAQTIAAILLAVSFWLPFWHLTLTTSEHPEGKRLTSSLGDLRESLESALAHVGKLEAVVRSDFAQLDRSLDLALMVVIILLLVAALLSRSRWAALLALPAALFPLIAVADTSGALVDAIDSLSRGGAPPCVCPMLLFFRRFSIGGVAVEVHPGAGLILAATVSLAVLAGVWFQLKNKPVR